jgi:hypothetical protein
MVERFFIHPVISVSLYTETPIYKRILKPKCFKLGMYTRKSPVLLKVQSNAVIENCKEKEIIFKIENLEFSLLSSHKNGKCTFVIRDHITGFARIYQVASFVELCWWFESFKRLKEKYLERISAENEGVVQDISFAVIPQPKRLSLKSVSSTLVEMEMFESHTISSLKNLQDLSFQLEELKNSIYRKNL